MQVSALLTGASDDGNLALQAPAGDRARLANSHCDWIGGYLGKVVEVVELER